MPENEAEKPSGALVFHTEGTGEEQEQEPMDDSLPGDALPAGEQAAGEQKAAGSAGAAGTGNAVNPAVVRENFPVLADRGNQEPTHIALSDAEVDEERTPEWQAMPHIPQEWRPLPLFLVRNIPPGEGGSEAEVKAVLEEALGISIRSVAVDDRRGVGRRTAIARLHPQPLSWEPRPAEEAGGAEGQAKAPSKGPPRDGDAASAAVWAVNRLKATQPPPSLGGQPLGFETGSQQVLLYIGNLSPEWQADDVLQEAMSKYGRLERAFVMRNAAGLSKGYAFVEYALPADALACKQAMDEIERNMRPDHYRRPAVLPKQIGQPPLPQQPQADAAAGGAQRVLRVGSDPGGRLVKLLRAEWASVRRAESLFSRVLYVANLRTNQTSGTELRDIFQQFGRVADVTVPRNKQTNHTKGFAFVAFSNGMAADRAYRALEKSGSEEIGGALVSFANPAKAADPARNMMRQQPLGGPGRGGPFMPGGGRGRGRGMFPGRGMGGEDEMMRQQAMHVQAGMAAQARLGQQLEMRVQQQMQAQQAAMQAQVAAQLRQAQMQLQQAQQAAAAAQRQAAQAQARAAAEAEARRRAEEEARRAATAQVAKRGASGGYGSAGYSQQPGYAASAGYGASSAGTAGYSAPAAAGYGAQAGYGGAQAGYAGYGYGEGEAAATGYEGAAAGYEGGEAASGYAAAGYGEDGSYGGYGATGGYGERAASAGGSRAAYGSAGGAEYAGYAAPGAEAGYGGAEVAYEQHAAYAGYGGAAGTAGGSGSAGRKRPAAPYPQAGSYGPGYAPAAATGAGYSGGAGYGGAAGGSYGAGYGSAPAGGGAAGGAYTKRPRY